MVMNSLMTFMMMDLLMMMMDLLLMMMMTRTTIPPTPTNDLGDFYFDFSFCIVYLNKMTFVLYLF